MLLGELYAMTLKTVSLCLLYAPLWPMAYLVTALALGLSYVATKFAVAKWWAKPPMVSEDMMEKMRARLGALMLLHTLISAMGANGASASVAGATSAYDLFNAGAESAGPVTAMLVLWIIYEVLDTPGLLARIPILRAYSEDTEGGDTHGVPYSSVEEVMKYEIDEYICPTAREDGTHSNAELIALVLRDFEEQQYDLSAEGGAPVYPTPPPPVAPPVPTTYPSAVQLTTYPAAAQPTTYPAHVAPSGITMGGVGGAPPPTMGGRAPTMGGGPSMPMAQPLPQKAPTMSMARPPTMPMAQPLPAPTMPVAQPLAGASAYPSHNAPPVYPQQPAPSTQGSFYPTQPAPAGSAGSLYPTTLQQPTSRYPMAQLSDPEEQNI